MNIMVPGSECRANQAREVVFHLQDIRTLCVGEPGGVGRHLNVHPEIDQVCPVLGMGFRLHPIIGAGSAGLAAAKELTKQGISFIVVEASHRIGGRAYSEEIAPDVISLGPVQHRGLISR